MSAAAVSPWARALEMTGNAASWMPADSTASASPSAADCISGEWKAPATVSGTTRRAPISLAISIARPSAS